MKHCLTSIYPDAAGGLPPEADPADLPAYLTDESRLAGRAEKIFLPRSEAEILALLRMKNAPPLTVSGGRTGITGGAVPEHGWLVSMANLSAFTGLRRDPEQSGCFRLRCQPGVTLAGLGEALDAGHFPGMENWPESDRLTLAELRRGPPCFFPPDPTERTASLGGMVACNASGARTLAYGPTRRYITGLRLALPDGALLAIERGAHCAGADGGFQFATPDGQVRRGRIPGYRMPDVKNAAGYYSAPGMDLIDLFIGAEGTLGIFTEIEILLVPAPEALLGAVAFFDDEQRAVQFVENARAGVFVGGRLLALEYFDARALNLLREQKDRQGAGSPIPALPGKAGAAVYIEIATAPCSMEETAETLLAMLEAAGSDPENAWTAMDDDEAIRLKNFRHALPEAVNQRIGERAAKYPGLTKLGTDFAVPDSALGAILQVYHAALQAAGFEYVIFGHIGNNHLHINILPRDLDEYRRGKEIYLQLARAALGYGGTISAEHGVGKLKKNLLQTMFGAEGIEAMRAVKRVFDPEGRINPGNMF